MPSIAVENCNQRQKKKLSLRILQQIYALDRVDWLALQCNRMEEWISVDVAIVFSGSLVTCVPTLAGQGPCDPVLQRF